MKPKRSLQINVRLSEEDLERMRAAATRLWPDLPVTNSTLILTLAKMQAEAVLTRKR